VRWRRVLVPVARCECGAAGPGVRPPGRRGPARWRGGPGRNTPPAVVWCSPAGVGGERDWDSDARAPAPAPRPGRGGDPARRAAAPAGARAARPSGSVLRLAASGGPCQCGRRRSGHCHGSDKFTEFKLSMRAARAGRRRPELPGSSAQAGRAAMPGHDPSPSHGHDIAFRVKTGRPSMLVTRRRPGGGPGIRVT
jgi:hypothetical protein